LGAGGLCESIFLRCPGRAARSGHRKGQALAESTLRHRLCGFGQVQNYLVEAGYDIDDVEYAERVAMTAMIPAA